MYRTQITVCMWRCIHVRYISTIIYLHVGVKYVSSCSDLAVQLIDDSWGKALSPTSWTVITLVVTSGPL